MLPMPFLTVDNRCEEAERTKVSCKVFGKVVVVNDSRVKQSGHGKLTSNVTQQTFRTLAKSASRA
jgi:hypothetical protein